MTKTKNTKTSSVNAGEKNIMGENYVKGVISDGGSNQRNPKVIVYGSSYDRGLIHLLEMWPDIKKAVPKAKLRIFYGWDLFLVGYRDNPERMAWKAKIDGLMEQDGITHLGRISHGAVKKEFENAGLWAYSTHFGEISCITGMKAQAYGAIPVVINYAALAETVQYGIKVDGDVYDQETKDEFKKQLIDLLNDEKRQEKIRSEMTPWAQSKFGWDKVAKQWSEEFKSKPGLDKQVAELMDDNQALKAWDLVKDTDSPLKDRIWLLVKHAFNEKDYEDYYRNNLVENPVGEDIALKIDEVFPRFKWLIPKLGELNPKTLVDLGCADGYLALTMAKKGVKCVGVNLYNASVSLANDRALHLSIPAEFVCENIFDHKKKYDAAVMFEVLEHLPDPQKGVDHTMSLLNKGGRAYFSTPRTDHLGVEQHKNEEGRKGWDDGKPAGHLRLFTENEFKALFANYKINEFFVDQERCMMVEVENV